MIILDSEYADIATPSGPMRTYLFRPNAPGRFPGLVFYSEIFQVTPPIRRIAAMLAGHGYVVAVPEIYHELEPAGTALGYDEAGTRRGNAHKSEKPLAAFDADAAAVAGHLKGLPWCTGRLGAMGVCIGGHLALRAGLLPDVRAVVAVQATDVHQGSLGAGGGADTIDRFSSMGGELLFVWGRQDPHIPDEGRRRIYAALAGSGARFQWVELDTNHAMLRDESSRGRYDPAMAHFTYSLALELFRRRLSSDAADESGAPAPSDAC